MIPWPWVIGGALVGGGAVATAGDVAEKVKTAAFLAVVGLVVWKVASRG